MSTVTLSASTSRERGSRNARRLRTSGSIPAVVYGHDVSSLAISVNAKACLLYTSRASRHGAHQSHGHRHGPESIPEVAHVRGDERSLGMLLVAPDPRAVAALESVVQDASTQRRD